MKPGRLISPPGTYFVTFSTWQRRRIFVVEPYVRLFLQTVYRYRREEKFQLHAFVVMPEHVHLLLTPSQEVTLERAVQLIKGGFSHALGAVIGRKREVWQRGFTDHRIRNEKDFLDHEEYIHQNPVRRRIAIRPSGYRYCSAFPGFKLDSWPSAAEAGTSSEPLIGTSEARALPDCK
ncbi:MAG TPA: transposase [Terriglobales bacterium]|nr:transposase [Terriglobales bacterium]